MKRSILLILCLGFVVFFGGIREGKCATQMMSKPPVQKPPSVDLTASVDLTVMVKWASVKSSNTKGIMCYSPYPIFTIKNTGQTAAKNFDYEIDWKIGNPNHNWNMVKRVENITLLPGSTKTIDFNNNPIYDQWWCVDDTDWKAGWRIRVDTKKEVTESNERNNSAHKIFTPPISKTAPRRRMKRDIQRTPTPR